MKKILIRLFLSVLLCGAFIIPAHALTQNVWFNDTNLNWMEFHTFDWAPGNALAHESVPLSTDPDVPTSFDLFYQASLSSFLTQGGGVISGTGLGSDYEVTIVSSAVEKGFYLPTGNINFAAFELDSTEANYVRIYYDSNVNANPLLGTGYTDGDLLMEGIITASNGNYTVTLDYMDADGEPIRDGFMDIVPLDNHIADDYVGTGTLKGIGSTVADVTIDEASIDSSRFWPSGALLLSLEMFFNTSQITPFNEVDPSAQILGVTPEYGTGFTDAYGNTWTEINGLPGADGLVDFHFQADANSSFEHTVIPEPSVLALTGFGLLMFSGLLRRKEK